MIATILDWLLYGVIVWLAYILIDTTIKLVRGMKENIRNGTPRQ